MYVCLCGYINGHEHAGAPRGWKKASDPLGLELQVVLSYLTWMLGAELWTSERSASIRNCHAISPTL